MFVLGHQLGSSDPLFVVFFYVFPCCQVEKAVSEAIGGVLFIDEAYALVRDGKERDGWDLRIL